MMYFGWLFAEKVSEIEEEVTGPIIMMVTELFGHEGDEVLPVVHVQCLVVCIYMYTYISRRLMSMFC